MNENDVCCGLLRWRIRLVHVLSCVIGSFGHCTWRGATVATAATDVSFGGMADGRPYLEADTASYVFMTSFILSGRKSNVDADRSAAAADDDVVNVILSVFMTSRTHTHTRARHHCIGIRRGYGTVGDFYTNHIYMHVSTLVVVMSVVLDCILQIFRMSRLLLILLLLSLLLYIYDLCKKKLQIYQQL